MIPTIQASLSPGQQSSGSLVNNTVPKTYLMVSASLSNVDHIARLRLYAVSSSLYNTQEKTRPFSTEPSASVQIVADMILSGSETTYFTPKIIGTNLQNLENNLENIRAIQEKIAGKNEIYYVLENAATTGGAQTIEVSMYVYSLED
jgi:hypothetical protein